MIGRTALASLVIVATLAVPVRAQVKLEYKFEEGSTFRLKTTTKTHQILTIAGMGIETDSVETTVTLSTVGKRNADGTLPVNEKVESIKSDIDLPGGIKVSFDSADPDAKIENPQLAFLGDVYKTLVGLTYTVVLDDHNKVKFVEGTEKALGKLEGLDPKVSAVLKSHLEAESIKRSFEKFYTNLPDILVRQGEPWERTETSEIGGGQTLTFKKQYEYLGTVDEGGKTLDKLGVKALEVTYAMDPASDSPLKHEKSDLKIDSSDGTILFDRQTGQTVKTAGKTRIKGDITFKAGGMDLPSKLDLTFDTSSEKVSASK